MKRLFLRALVVAVSAVFLLIAPMARADSETTGFAVLPADGLVLDATTYSAPLTVVNATPRPMSVLVVAVLRTEAGEAAGVELSKPQPVVLAPGAEDTITVTADGGAAGVVVVSASTEGAVLTAVELQVTTAGEPKPPEAAVESISVTQPIGWVTAAAASATPAVPSERCVPGRNEDGLVPEERTGSGCAHITVPLSAKCDPAWVTPLVLADKERSLPATARCEKDTIAIRYDASTAHPGSYVGSLALGETELPVALTLQRPAWLAIVLAGLGLVVVWILNAAARLLAPLNSLRKRLEKANAAVAEQLSAADLARFTHDTSEESEAIDGYLMPPGRTPRALGWLVTTIDEADLGKLRSAVAERETDAGKVPELAPALHGLDSVRLSLLEAPALRAQADAVLEAKDEPYRGGETIAKIKALAGIASGRELAEQLRGDLDALSTQPLATAARSRWLEARAEIELLIRKIDECDEPTGLLKELTDTLRAVSATIATLVASLPPQILEEAAGQRFFIEGAVAMPDRTIPNLAAIAMYLKGSLTTLVSGAAPWLLFLIAAVVAFSAGLALFHVDKPWGTWADCLAAFLYGATTLAAALSLSTFFGDRGRQVDG